MMLMSMMMVMMMIWMIKVAHVQCLLISVIFLLLYLQVFEDGAVRVVGNVSK